MQKGQVRIIHSHCSSLDSCPRGTPISTSFFCYANAKDNINTIPGVLRLLYISSRNVLSTAVDALSTQKPYKGRRSHYEVISRSSFDEIASFREHILRVKDKYQVPMVLVGNKCDLESERQVTASEGQELAKRYR